MKKYSNIPLKERKRNADRCYRHEDRLEEIKIKRMIKEKERQWSQDSEYKTDKEQENAEVFKMLESFAEGWVRG